MFAALLNADRAFGVWLAARISSPWLDHVMVFASTIGARGAVWIVVAIVTWFAVPSKRMAAYRVLLSLALAGLLVDHVVKPLVGRTRPFVDHPEYRELGVRPSDPSFPSGHAATAAAGAFTVSQLWPAAAPIVWPAAIVIAVSRVALGVHFPSDVIAGFIFGYAAARVVCARPPREPAPDRVVHAEVPVL
jgi:undecaprenyl-diphosphatase